MNIQEMVTLAYVLIGIDAAALIFLYIEYKKHGK